MKKENIHEPETATDHSGRQRIVSAARKHFFAFGFRAVTMDDLARELAMSKKTLYAHFPSKAALLEAVILDKARSVEVDLNQITSEQVSDFLTALHCLLARVLQHLEEIQPPFIRDLRRESPEMFGIVETRRREIIHKYFGKLVEEGQSTGIIRKDVPISLIVEILLGAVQAIMNPAKLTELNMPPKEVFSVIITVILEGLIVDRGRPTP